MWATRSSMSAPLNGLVRHRVAPRPMAFTRSSSSKVFQMRVASADGTVKEVELRLLEEVREELQIDRLHAAAIEWGARVRHLRP